MLQSLGTPHEAAGFKMPIEIKFLCDRENFRPLNCPPSISTISTSNTNSTPSMHDTEEAVLSSKTSGQQRTIPFVDALQLEVRDDQLC